MKRFAVKLFIFLFPFLLLYGFPFYVLFVSGDLAPVEQVIREQKMSKALVLFGPAYSNFSPYFRLKSVLEREPDIVSLGTSRVMQFRSRFFRSGVSFYNAGGAVYRIEHFESFLEKIPSGKEPKLIFMGLDQYFFNPNWNDETPGDFEKQLSANNYNALDILLDNWQQVYSDYFGKKYSLRSLSAGRKNNLIGLNALANGNGTRNDGSYRDAKYIRDPFNPKNSDYQFKNVFDRIAKGDRRFEYSETISEGAIGTLERFLKKCKERGVHVVGFLPPYPHVVYEKMVSMPQYQYLSQIAPHLKPLFARYGFDFYDFSDISWIGASDTETLDGLHGSEKAYLRAFTVMVESSSTLRHYAQDIAYLKKVLYDAPNDYEVFGDVF